MEGGDPVRVGSTVRGVLGGGQRLHHLDGQSDLPHSSSLLTEEVEEGGAQELPFNEEVEWPLSVECEEGVDDLR